MKVFLPRMTGSAGRARGTMFVTGFAWERGIKLMFFRSQVHSPSEVDCSRCRVWTHPALRSYRLTAPTTSLASQLLTGHRTSSAVLLSTTLRRRYTQAQDLVHLNDNTLGSDALRLMPSTQSSQPWHYLVLTRGSGQSGLVGSYSTIPLIHAAFVCCLCNSVTYTVLCV